MSVLEVVVQPSEIRVAIEEKIGLTCRGQSRIHITSSDEYGPRPGVPPIANLSSRDGPTSCEWHLYRSSLVRAKTDDASGESVLHDETHHHPRFADFVKAHEDDVCVSTMLHEGPKTPGMSDAWVLISMNDALFEVCLRNIERIQGIPTARMHLNWIVGLFPTADVRAKRSPEQLLKLDLHFDEVSREMFACSTGGSIQFRCPRPDPRREASEPED